MFGRKDGWIFKIEWPVYVSLAMLATGVLQFIISVKVGKRIQLTVAMHRPGLNINLMW